MTLASLGLGMYGEHVLAGGIRAAIGESYVSQWLVLHGFAGSARTLLRFFPDASAPDLPGHGRSPDATSWDDALALANQ